MNRSNQRTQRLDPDKRRPTRWQWGTTKNGLSVIVLNNGVMRFALARDGEPGEWTGLGAKARAHETTGTWRPLHMMPIALQKDANDY